MPELIRIPGGSYLDPARLRRCPCGEARKLIAVGPLQTRVYCPRCVKAKDDETVVGWIDCDPAAQTRPVGHPEGEGATAPRGEEGSGDV